MKTFFITSNFKLNSIFFHYMMAIGQYIDNESNQKTQLA